MKLFGLLGVASTVLGGCTGLVTAAMKFFGGVDMTGNPLLLLTVFSFMAGLQFFSLGLLGEVCARIYYAADNKRNYSIRELVNFTPAVSQIPANRAA